MLDFSDQDLVARAQGGDVDAIGELYTHHHEGIFRYVWSRVDERGLAEDMTGEVFMRMLGGLPDYRSKGVPFRAWLYRIARNLLIDYYRKERDRVSVPIDQMPHLSQGDDDPASAVEQKLTVERLHLALSQIDASQREVVTLRFLSGLPLREVALTMDKSISAVKSLQHRGLSALRIALAQEQG